MSGEMTPLQLGIAALKTQNYTEARKQLVLAISQDPENAEPWLWLGIVATNLDERIQYLEQAVSIEPDNARAQRLLDTLHKQQIDVWIQDGISAVQAGNTIRGAQHLEKAIAADESQLEAWWWLGQASDSPEDKAVCYENVLTLDPEHAGAQLALKALKQIETEESVVLDQSNDTVEVGLLTTPVSETVEDLTSQQDRSETLAEPEEQEDLLGSVLSCPFCATQTDENDKKCPQCNRSLYLQQRSISRPKPRYRIIIALENGIFLNGILVTLLMLGLLNMFVNANDNRALLRAYLMSNKQLLSNNLEIAFSIISPLSFYTALVCSLIAVLIIFCVLSRWQPLFYVAVSLSTIRILACMLNIVLLINGLTASASISPGVATGDMFIKPTCFSLIGAVVIIELLSATALFLLINIQDHFHIKQIRRYLQLDNDVADSSPGLRQRARLYARERAWSLAALHARESLLFKQEIEGYTLLATAYYHLGWQEKVSHTIDDALAVSPQNTQLIELREALEQHIAQKTES